MAITPKQKQPGDPILTASVTDGIARVTRGIKSSLDLIDEVLRTNHVDWETILVVGDVEYHVDKNGPVPNHQMRISVQPATGYAALNYTDHDDAEMPIANSYNPKRPLPEVHLIFNGTTGSVFPRAAAIPIGDAREALAEWLQTRKRPVGIEWRPFDIY